MDGVLNLLKPPGMTSHDVVDFVRRTLGLRRVGHTGTLDPGAAGVLPVCLGRATRVSEYLLGCDKAYRAVMVLGVATDTHDAQGRVTAVADASGVTREDVERLLPRFRGVISQVPPMTSAARVGGERLYRLARAGKTVERPPRQITVYTLELVDWRPGPRPAAYLDVVCSKGTYVRTLCHDLGAALGCGAYLHFLVRTAQGPFRQEESVTLEELAGAAARGEVRRHLVPPAAALSFLPAVTLRPEEVRRVTHGQPPFPRGAGELAVAGPLAGRLVRLCAPAGDLVAVARAYPQPRGGGVGFRLEKVLA